MVKISVPETRRWKLRPEELTLIKLGLESLNTKIPCLEKQKKSLLNRMKGNFFILLYATGDWSTEEVPLSEDTGESAPPNGLG